MPQELLDAAYFTPVREGFTKFDDHLNSLMVEFMRDMMHTINAMDISAFECYHSMTWDRDRILDVVLEEPNVEFWSVHAPYGRHTDPSSAVREIREQAVAAYCDAVTVAARLGAKVVVAHPGANVDYGLSKAEQIEFSASSLMQIADIAGKHGISIAVEPLPKQEIGSKLDEVLEIVERINRSNVGVNFDVNHLYPPEEIPSMIRQAGSPILSVHISDQDGIERHWLPFEGTMDWREVLRALVDVGYTGPLIYETHIRDVKNCDEVGRAIVENYPRLVALAP